MLKKNISKQEGSTLIEVLVAMTIVATILTALGSMMAMSVKVAERNEMEQLARLKAQETLEYFRKERSIRGWNSFYNMTAGTDNQELSYCFNDLPASIEEISGLSSDCGSDVVTIDLASFDFQREVNITRQIEANPTQSSVQIEVEIYRGVKSAGEEPFMSLSQEFKAY